MNTQRAVQIAASPELAHVTYEETAVYIQHVDERNEIARIYPLGHPEQEQDVPVHMLRENMLIE